MSAYANIRAAIADEGVNQRVEVNQRALIDKILARYASAGAVYRELLQNSNDAEASRAEIHITTVKRDQSVGKEEVTQVLYRNNGLPFRPQDWARLRKIAEGNPDETKVGAFGVGAYTMFSVCEEPIVVSGPKGKEEALAFFWKGDSLWTKTGKAPKEFLMADSDQNWTSFILPSRDPYPVPDLVEFGQFLAASLTFTQCLISVKVHVNDVLCLSIDKANLESRVIATPKSSWWSSGGAVTSTSSGMFALGSSGLIQTSVELNVSLRKGLRSDCAMETSKVRARYASATAKTKIPPDVEKRMVRVTKKRPPKEVKVQILLDAADHDPSEKSKNTRAFEITQSFSPSMGSGRIFIGFRTSQTTGLGIHLAAPLMPTVEREAIDFVDAALRSYNSGLLEIAGIVSRLTLEHEMARIGELWQLGAGEREEWEAKREERKKQKGSVEEKEDKADGETVTSESTTISSSLFSFATFMARGVKEKVTEVVKQLPVIGEDDETTELLNPLDDRPLSVVELDAILLMKAYCPRQSTPDTLVGQALAKGFSRCLSTMPPVLTKGGVCRGSDAKLPSGNGIEAFVHSACVRRVMFDNATEYHSLVASVPKVNANDLIRSLRDEVLDEAKLIRLLKWYAKATRVDRSLERFGLRIKESIKYEVVSAVKKADVSPAKAAEPIEVRRLDDILYFASDELGGLPLPEAVFDTALLERVGRRTLENRVYEDWFSTLPFDIWASFISQHPAMQTGQPQEINLKVLVAFSKHYTSIESTSAKRRFVELLPVDAPCVPYEGGFGRPSDMYLASSDLSAFEGCGQFYKVSEGLVKAGVSETFLQALGVRKTISIDVLFNHLDTLKWNNNCRPLIQYLVDAELSAADMLKLRSTQYLPAEGEDHQVYAPSELYLKSNPNELAIFPFVRFLQWPSSEGISKRQRDFLVKLGLRTEPSLTEVMSFILAESKKSDKEKDGRLYMESINFVVKRLGPHGLYEKDIVRYRATKFLPCIRQNLESGDMITELQAPTSCYYNPSAITMGFPTLDPQLDTINLATRLSVLKDPLTGVLVKRLIQLVDICNAKIDYHERTGKKREVATQVESLFTDVFQYLSTRTSDFKKTELNPLTKKAFIPCKSRGNIAFYLASQVFFEPADQTSREDSLAETLFKTVPFNSFLSLVGVKSEPSLRELFSLMLEKPDAVLDSLGEASYKALLRRIAANPPFRILTKEIRSCPFLLGYLVIDEDLAEDEEKKEGHHAQYVLACAEDIFIVDNSFLRRQFPMLCAPMEQSLEDFYASVGSRYVSQVVKKEHEVNGRTSVDTPLTRSFAARLRERRPLLLSPMNSNRALAKDAATVLSDDNLVVLEADQINAKYSFQRASKSLKVTCCYKRHGRNKTTIYITQSFDWFDVGGVVADLILARSQLEDALLLSQLLESKLETLRYRGFPVDRIIKPVSRPKPISTERPIDKSVPGKQPPTAQPMSDNKPQTSRTSEKDSSDKSAVGNPSDEQAGDGFGSILQQMFPSVHPSTIQNLLGPNPSKEKAREVANQLATSHSAAEGTKGPPDKPSHGDEKFTAKPDSTQKKKPSRFMSKFTKPFRNTSQGTQHITQDSLSFDANNTPTSPEHDAFNHNALESMIDKAVKSTQSISSAGICSPETHVHHNLPQGLERGDTCEIIPSQNIKPHGIAKNGIRIFCERSADESFLQLNRDAVEHFSVVIQNLAAIFSVALSSVAIYYDPKGSTIAFNSNRSLYFNLRYFCSLHMKRIDSACYSYWYITFAHELAHNLVTGHNKEHGSYTENISAMYLPEFSKLLARIG